MTYVIVRYTDVESIYSYMQYTIYERSKKNKNKKFAARCATFFYYFYFLFLLTTAHTIVYSFTALYIYETNI